MRKYMRGVTLTELMIVVVIVSVLSMIAYPNYRQFAARAKRNEAKSCLLQVAALQERFYLTNNSYTTNMTNLGFAAVGANTTDSGSYVCNVTSADSNNFTAAAIYQNADEEASKCGSFGIDGRGNKTSAPYTDCWTRSR